MSAREKEILQKYNYLTPISKESYNEKMRSWNWLFKCNITDEYLYKLFIEQHEICKLSGLKLSINLKDFTASIDRIDSNMGYIIGNVQWLHKDVNYLKYDLDIEELYYICEKIKNKHGI